jgi:hypothetical protein
MHGVVDEILVVPKAFAYTQLIQTGIKSMAIARRKTNRKSKRVAWTKQHVGDLKAHSKKKTPVATISKSMKRTPGAIRQKALSLEIPIGHRR